ncbi:MAG: tetratricopeptide repeat protein [Deltaproteobacteria bacterium]|nr:tetratricopeptide repeat protein [Deltaproteobacteria bacterium]
MENTLPLVYDATDHNFEETVIRRSQTVPVLVDLWAEWCGPCKVLGPLLDKLAAEYKGRFVVAKVDVDHNPGLAQAFQVQSIPAVKLVVAGQLKDHFMGALPEPQIRAFLDANLPAAGGGDEADQALAALPPGDKEAALKHYQGILAQDPANPSAILGLAHLMAESGQWEEAQKMADSIEEKPENKRNLNGLKAKVYLGQQAEAPLDHPLGGAFQTACRQALAGDFQPALDGFLDILKKDRKFAQDGGRQGMLKVFDLLPPDSPLLPEYRQKLSFILFS